MIGTQELALPHVHRGEEAHRDGCLEEGLQGVCVLMCLCLLSLYTHIRYGVLACACMYLR